MSWTAIILIWLAVQVPLGIVLGKAMKGPCDDQSEDS